MLIERTAKEVIIRIPSTINTDDLQEFVDYVRYKELTAKVKISQKQVDKIARDINKDWWKKNRKKLVK